LLNERTGTVEVTIGQQMQVDGISTAADYRATEGRRQIDQILRIKISRIAELRVRPRRNTDLIQ
jgi:hypothetical protein